MQTKFIPLSLLPKQERPSERRKAICLLPPFRIAETKELCSGYLKHEKLNHLILLNDFVIILNGLSVCMTSSSSLYGNSGCIGNLSKSQSLPDSKLKGSFRSKPQRSSIGKRRRWPSGREAMENNASISVSLEGNISSIPNSIVNDSKMSMENGIDASFINHAAEAWFEMRRQWVGHQADVRRKAPREPVISWCTTYDDLLSTSEHFPETIPLSEMVDFLVDIWHEEGLYD